MSCFNGNTLVVYYTRTGRCKKVAQYLETLLNSDIDCLKDKQDYTGKRGLLICATKAIFRRPTVLSPTKFDPSYYDDVVLVSPIWAGKTCPAIRTYVAAHADKFKRVHLVTCGGLSSKKGVRRELAHDYGLQLERTLGVTVDDVDSDIFGHHLRMFVSEHYDEPRETPPASDESVAANDDDTPQTYPADSPTTSHKEINMNKNETNNNASSNSTKQSRANNTSNNSQNAEAQNNGANNKSNNSAQNSAQNNGANNKSNNANNSANNSAQNNGANNKSNNASNKSSNSANNQSNSASSKAKNNGASDCGSRAAKNTSAKSSSAKSTSAKNSK